MAIAISHETSKHTYVCSEQRAVVHHAVLMQTEVRTP